MKLIKKIAYKNLRKGKKNYNLGLGIFSKASLENGGSDSLSLVFTIRGGSIE